MHRAIIIATVAMLFATAIPTTFAGETRTAEYDVPSGANPAMCGRGVTCGVATRPCAVEWDEGVFSDSGDETVFGPAGFDKDNNPDDLASGTVCGTGRSALGRGDDGVLRVGVFSAALRSVCGDCYGSFLVSVVDTLPTSAYYVFCVITQYQDGRGGSDNTCGEVSDCTSGVDPAACDDIPDPRSAGCGAASLTSTVPSGGALNRPVAFVFASFVDESTGAACLGSKGTVTVSMS